MHNVTKSTSDGKASSSESGTERLIPEKITTSVELLKQLLSPDPKVSQNAVWILSAINRELILVYQQLLKDPKALEQCGIKATRKTKRIIET